MTKLIAPKITEGQWAAVEYESGGMVIHSSDEKRVCFMATPGSRDDPAIIAADALFLAGSKRVAEAAARLLNIYGDRLSPDIFLELHAALRASGYMEVP